ncbi:MAG: hypothetical protein EOP56_17895 [Sphingobacteriales bacterium]|nr:MAG: hypothetical protein EOP56_17895 [Sphingobacteriales bacterium]
MLGIFSASIAAFSQQYSTLYLDSLSTDAFFNAVKVAAPKAGNAKHNKGILGKIPADRITKQDVAALMPYIRSIKKTGCIVAVYCSYMPSYSEYSTLGGIAMDLIDTYRKKEDYPKEQWSCTKTDRNRADEIEQWWKSVNGTSGHPRR